MTAAAFQNEGNRIDFLVNRDGLESALESVRVILIVYRRAVLHSRKRGHQNPHFASTPNYRETFIRSYAEFKKFLQLHNRYGK